MSIKYLGLAFALALPAAHVDAQTAHQPCKTEGVAPEEIKLEAATLRAQKADLRTAVGDANVAAAATEMAIARLRPADTLSLDIEDFPGIGIGGFSDNLQVTGQFSRVWERGGKRQARETLAERSRQLAETGRSGTGIQIRSEIETLYIQAVYLEQQYALACERVEISADLQTAIDRRVTAARDPLLAGARVSSDRLKAEADARRFAAQARDARAAMASYWGGDEDIRLDPAVLDRLAPLRPIEFDNLSSPELDRLEAERRAQLARVELERASAKPDVTWSIGARKYGFQDDAAVVGGISIPLGTASRAEANVASAQANVRRVTAEAEAARQQLLRDVMSYRRASLSARDAIEEIDATLIPAAENALQLARDGYQRGAFSYLEIIDAQRVLTELREARLSHLLTYSLNEAALSRLLSPMASRLETFP